MFGFAIKTKFRISHRNPACVVFYLYFHVPASLAPTISLGIYCFVPHLTGFIWISIAHSLLNIFQIWQCQAIKCYFSRLYSHQTVIYVIIALDVASQSEPNKSSNPL